MRCCAYGFSFHTASWQSLRDGLAPLTLAAIVGAFLGVRLLMEVTLMFVHIVVAVMMSLLARGSQQGFSSSPSPFGPLSRALRRRTMTER